MEQFLEKGFGQFVGFLCFFVSYWFALQFFLFFLKRKWKDFTAWLKWWEVSTCGHSKKVMSSRDTIPPSFFCFSVLPIFLMKMQNAICFFFFTPVWLFNSLGYEMKWSVSSTRKRFRSELALSLPFFNVLGGCGCDSREICAGDLWWFSAFEACLIQVARTWIHPVSMALTYPFEKGLAVGKM